MIKFLIPVWLLWGCNWVVMKTANNYFPPTEFVTWRFATGTLVLLLYILYKGLNMPDRKYWLWIILSGVTGIGINNCLVQTSMQYLGAGMAAVINYSMPVWILIPAHFLLNEKITLKKFISIIISLSGLCILLNVDTNNTQFIGILLALGSAWCWALCCLILKMKLSDCPPVQLTCGQMAAGAVAVGLFNILNPVGEVNWCMESIICLAYNGILASAVCFFLWSYVLQHMEAGKAGTAVLVAPAVGVLAGIIFLGESFTVSTALGMGLVAIGVVSAVITKK